MSIVPRRKETAREQVFARMGLARAGSLMQTMVASLIGKGFLSVPLINSPIATGMIETMAKPKAIVLKQSAVSGTSTVR
jgi:hypothetical protein